MKVVDIAKTIAPEMEQEIIGIRPGEKIHEQMIGIEDVMYAYEYDKYFKILPAIQKLHLDKNRILDGKKVESSFTYSSDKNEEWMTKEELNNWINSNIDDLGKI